MENIEKLLKQIFDNQNDMKNDISNIRTTQGSMQNDISSIKNDISHINSKLDSVVDQTAGLTEFRTETDKNFRI